MRCSELYANRLRGRAFFPLARNRGVPPDALTTVNLDFMRMYRPLTNVVTRPTAESGRGYSLVGHHEIMIPVIAAAVLDLDSRG